jgi:Protein of unknown function (DUF4058)
MPLLDHFHTPLYPLHSWESFHARWAGALLDLLNRLLPPHRYLAEMQVRLGTQVEADVAEFELPVVEAMQANGAGGVAVQTYAPPVATASVPIVFPDDIEVQVFDLRDGKQLVGAIELISPANKDRPETRRAFAIKCAAYLHRGIGLINVDTVTSRHANLHHEMMELLGQAEAALLAPETHTYAVAYRPARRNGANSLDVWPVPLAVGSALPVLPLGLRGAFFVPVDLESTYSEARQRSRL